MPKTRFEEFVYVIRRILSKLVDLTLLFTTLMVAADVFSIAFSLGELIALTAILPLVWVLPESLFLKLFKTTPGKYLTGLTTPRRLTWKEALTASFIGSLKTILLLIPIYNVVAAIVLLRTEKKSAPLFVRCKRKMALLILSWVLYIGASSYSWYNIDMDPGYDKKMTLATKGDRDLNWIEHTCQSWKAHFPATPEEKPFKLKLPKNEVDPLDLNELVYIDESNGVNYSISSLEIPHNLMSWGAKHVLRGSLDVVIHNVPGAKISYRKIFPYHGYSSLLYTYESGEKSYMGRLVLVGSTLYRIEATYSAEQGNAIEQELSEFINSFRAL